MNRIDPDTWAKLEGARPSGDMLVARLALPEVSDRLHCALDGEGIRHLLIALRPDESELRDFQSRGVSVITRDLVVEGLSTANYLDIECKEITGHPVFDLIGGEIADELKDSVKNPADIVKHVLAKWRRFWGQVPQQLLSKEELLGLFGELWFLSVWLFPKFGNDVISTWRGPWGSRHDFEWSDKSVEVKATTNSRGRVLHINSLNQLEPSISGPLFLFCLSLREEAGSTNNLPKLIENCRSKLVGAPDALTRLESGLLQVGYSPVHEEEYAKYHIRINEEALFIVHEGFPRIVTASFSPGIPSGVEHIEYEVNLNAFNHLIVATHPEQIPF